MTILTLDPWKDPIPRESTQKVVGQSYGIFTKKNKWSLKHIPREKKKYTQIVWTPFCNVYTNHIYIVKKML